jgi:uncharacterized repeat protein (TIGR01451 family)
VTQGDLDAGGSIGNVATAHGTGVPDVSDDASVPVEQNPALSIQKDVVVADGQSDKAGDVINYTVTLTNGGNTTLTGVVLTDTFENSAPVVLNNDNSDPSKNTFAGDTDGDHNLDVGETWVYTYQHIITANDLSTRGIDGDGKLDNIATVTTHETGPGSDSASIPILIGPGVRTPGFWANSSWQKFWDGTSGNEPKQAGTLGFPTGELAYQVDSNNDGIPDTKKGLLIGDFNTDGKTDAGEHTIFMTTADALTLLNASQKQQQDERYVLGRDMVASWLNYLAGNGIGAAPPAPVDLNSPRHYLDDSVPWLDNTTNGDHLFSIAELTRATAVAANSPTWQATAFGLDLSGSQLHSGLDEYNNKGTINGVVYASSAG